jgi:hypothetical protein
MLETKHSFFPYKESTIAEMSLGDAKALCALNSSTPYRNAMPMPRVITAQPCPGTHKQQFPSIQA